MILRAACWRQNFSVIAGCRNATNESPQSPLVSPASHGTFLPGDLPKKINQADVAMKKIFPVRWTPWLLSINAAIAVLLSGCATPEEHSFNHDFGETLPARPQYYIHDEDEKRFHITVQQGTPLTGAERVFNVKEAATTIAKAECQRLGWKKWKMNYIQERNQGWMHVVIAKVVREEYIEPTFPKPGGTP
jgi:hypothetical protein